MSIFSLLMIKKVKAKMLVDILMLVIMLLEYSKLYTGQLLHEIFGIVLFILFVILNILNLNFYKNFFKWKYDNAKITYNIWLLGISDIKHTFRTAF